MDDVSILNEDSTNAVHAVLLHLHDAVGRREAGRPEAALSPDELFSRFRAADPTRNTSCLPWLLRTYAAGGYRFEDLSKAHDTLAAFARLRGLLPNTATIDGETRNPRKLGSHVTLASLWSVIAPFVEAERLAQEEEAGENVDTDRERALSQSRVLYRSARVVIAVPMTKEASCWWGQGTQWCTAARNNNAFEEYHSKAPLIVICLRKNGDLPARKLQLHVHASGMQFMDENDAEVSQELVSERWQDLEALLYWAVGKYGRGLEYVPEHLRTEAVCLIAVAKYGRALTYVPELLRTKAICLAAVGRDGRALTYVPEPLRTEEVYLAALTGYGLTLYDVPEHLRTEAICLAAVGSNGGTLRYVPEHLRVKAICSAAVSSNGRALEYVPEPLRTEAICTAAIGSNGMAMYHVPKHLRTEAMCTTAVGTNGGALKYVPESLRTEAMCLTAVGKTGDVLAYVPEHLRTEAICIVAVGINGMALRYVPEHLCTEAVCLAAVGRNGKAIEYVPEPLRTEAMYLAAVGNYGWVLRYVPNHLRTEAVCLVAVSRDGLALKYVPEPLRTEVICTAAVGRDKIAIYYVPEHLRTDVIQLVTKTHNECKNVFANSETHAGKSHDLLLVDLENYLNKMQSDISCSLSPR